MTTESKGVPEGASAVIPRLFCANPVGEIDFCKTTFEAEQLNLRNDAQGRPAHALLKIGNSMLMIESQWPGVANKPPQPDGSSPVVIYVYVENADATIERAITAGAKILVPLENQFWGDRIGWIIDPAGHVWTVASRIEETTEEERRARLEKLQAEERKAQQTLRDRS